MYRSGQPKVLSSNQTSSFVLQCRQESKAKMSTKKEEVEVFLPTQLEEKKEEEPEQVSFISEWKTDTKDLDGFWAHEGKNLKVSLNHLEGPSRPRERIKSLKLGNPVHTEGGFIAVATESEEAGQNNFLFLLHTSTFERGNQDENPIRAHLELNQPLSMIAWGPAKSSTIVGGTHGGTLMVFNVDKEANTVAFSHEIGTRKPDDVVTGIVFLPSRPDLVVFAGDYGKICVVNVDKREIVRSFTCNIENEADAISSIRLYPFRAGTISFTSEAQGYVYTWDVLNGDPVLVLAPGGGVEALGTGDEILSHCWVNEHTVLLGSVGGKIYEADVRNPRNYTRRGNRTAVDPYIHSPGYITNIEFEPSVGQILVSGSADFSFYTLHATKRDNQSKASITCHSEASSARNANTNESTLFSATFISSRHILSSNNEGMVAIYTLRPAPRTNDAR